VYRRQLVGQGGRAAGAHPVLHRHLRAWQQHEEAAEGSKVNRAASASISMTCVSTVNERIASQHETHTAPHRTAPHPTQPHHTTKHTAPHSTTTHTAPHSTAPNHTTKHTAPHHKASRTCHLCARRQAVCQRARAAVHTTRAWAADGHVRQRCLQISSADHAITI
jgi:hypothetical protein